MLAVKVPSVTVTAPFILAASAKDVVPPVPFIVIGFIVLPADVIDCVPEVAMNDIAPVLAVVDIPASNVRLPVVIDNVLAPCAHVPKYPVKSRLVTLPLIATESPPVLPKDI